MCILNRQTSDQLVVFSTCRTMVIELQRYLFSIADFFFFFSIYFIAYFMAMVKIFYNHFRLQHYNDLPFAQNGHFRCSYGYTFIHLLSLPMIMLTMMMMMIVSCCWWLVLLRLRFARVLLLLFSRSSIRLLSNQFNVHIFS